MNPEDAKAVRDAVAALSRDWEEFKKSNDEELAELKKKGSVDVVLKEKVDRINEALTDQQEKLQKVTQDLNLIATKAARSGPGADPEADAKEAKAAERLNIALSAEKGRLHDPERPILSLEEYRRYKAGVAKYLRKGRDALGPDMLKDLSEGSDPDGGYFASEEMANFIITRIWETTDIPGVANVVVISGRALEIPVDTDEASCGWVGETDTRNTTGTPKIGKKEINAHELYAMPSATQNLLDDAGIDVESWLGGKIADKMARTANAAFVNGTGVAQPRGFLTYTAGTDITKQQIEQVVSGDANLVTIDGLYSLEAALKVPYRNGAQFLMARQTVASIRKLKDATTGVYLWQPILAMNQPAQLLGYPMMLGADMPAVAANALAIAFGNFKQAYTIVRRMGIRILRDPYTSKGSVLFYTTMRIGGDVTNFEALKLQKIST